MADEIELLYTDFGIRHFCFADDALTINREATIGLCDEIINRKLKIAFHATTRTDCVDEVILAKLKEAGCYKIAYGIETASPKLLENMGKENDIGTSERAITLTKKAGIIVTALIIVGSVGETPETVQETVNFLKRTKPDEVGSVGGLWILPGTKLYRESKKIGFIDDNYWLKNEPFKIYTVEYSREQLDKFNRQVYGYRNIFSRIIKRLRKRIS